MKSGEVIDGSRRRKTSTVESTQV
uniref:Uncharacterized protein n=1 Tax=Arundo donax TaxID=35708 RepID=A0A0A9BIC7_ARUDO